MRRIALPVLVALVLAAAACSDDGTQPVEVGQAPGPTVSPTGGEGWRLLADEPGRGEPYATGFAGTPAELVDLWARIGLDGEPPAVDFATEVVLWFGPAVSGSCDDIRLDDVVLDGDRVLPVIVLAGGRSCTDDANPHAYVVAFERARLPQRFVVSIDPPNASCCPEGTTEVDLGDG